MSDVLKRRGTHDLITRTVRGHKRPDAVTEASVFIFTDGCIYALDEDGFCLEIISAGTPRTPGLPLQQTLPEDVNIFVTSDDGVFISGSIEEVRQGVWRALLARYPETFAGAGFTSDRPGPSKGPGSFDL